MPPKKLAELTEQGDARADAIWYRTGDNSRDTGTGRPGNSDLTDDMRSGVTDPQMQARIDDISSVMAESELPATIEVYRGVRYADELLGPEGSRVGQTFTDEAFLSTSTDPEWAAGFGPTLLRIRVPAGTRAIRTADREPDQVESEILLDRRLQYRVVAEGDTLNGQPVVDVEIVPARARAAPSRSVTQLRKAVTDRGITVPTSIRGPALRQLAEDLENGMPPAAARARAVTSIIDERRAVASALTEAEELVANGASQRALAAVAARLRTTLDADALKTARPLLDAMQAGDTAAIRAAIPAVARAAKLRQVGGNVGAVSRLDRSVMGEIGEGRAATAVTRSGREALEAPPIWVSQRTMSFGGPVDIRGLEGFTAAQRERILSAIEAYRGLGYQGVNRYLRTGESVRGARSVVAEIDRAMAQSRLPDNLVLWRGIPSGERTFGGNVARDLTGFEWTDPAYISTSSAREIAERGGPVLMRLATPPGTGAIRLSDFEAEVLLQRGLTFRVVRDNGLVDGRRLLDVEVIPVRAVGAEADAVRVVRPGWATTFERQPIVLQRAAVVRSGIPVPAKAAAKKAPAKKVAAPKPPRPSGLPADRRVVAADYEDLAGRLFTRTEAEILDVLQDLKSTELAGLARQFRGPAVTDAFGLVIPGRTQGFKLPAGLTVAEERQVLAAAIVSKNPQALSNALDRLERQIGKPLRNRAEVVTKANRLRRMQGHEPAPVPPKPPTPPERMSTPALTAELRSRGALEPARIPGTDRSAPLDLTGVPKDTLAGWVSRARELRPDQLAEEVGRWRQVIIDRRRVLAEVLSETDELVENLAAGAARLSPRDVERIVTRLEGRIRRAGEVFEAWPDAQTAARIVAAVRGGNVPQLRRALEAAAKKHQLTRIGGQAGDATTFDRASMTAIGDIQPGARVVVVRPGYSLPDGTVIARPSVREFEPDALALPSRQAETPQELMAAARGGALQRDMETRIQRVVDGEWSGIRTRLSTDHSGITHRASGKQVYITGELVGPTGRKVGTFTRRIELEPSGDLVAHHEYLSINSNLRGSGFAEAFNENLLDWYRRSGIKRVYLAAGDEVGGYAWARAGYQFADATAADQFTVRAVEKITDALAETRMPRGVTRQQLLDLQDYIQDVRAGRRRADIAEISQFGRRPGQAGRAAVWPGKWLLLGGDAWWDGVLYL